MSKENKNTETVSTEVSSNLNLMFNKEDLVFIAKESEEKRITVELDAVQQKSQEIENSIEEQEDSITEAIVNILKSNLETSENVTITDIKVSTLEASTKAYLESERVKFEYYDINKAMDLKNPKIALKSGRLTIDKSRAKLYKREFPQLNIDYITKGNILGKSLKSEKSTILTTVDKLDLKTKELKSISNLVDKHYESYMKLLDIKDELFKESNKLQLDLILLDTDSSLKVKLFKNILEKNPEITKLLN